MGGKKQGDHPPESYHKCLKPSAVSKSSKKGENAERAQNCTASLPYVKRSLQINFYFQKTPSKCSLNACPAARYPASTRPLLFRVHTYLTGQPLFNKGIKLHYEEKCQFSGPTNKETSTESTIYH